MKPIHRHLMTVNNISYKRRNVKLFGIVNHLNLTFNLFASGYTASCSSYMKVKSCIDGRADVAFLLYKHGIRLRRERLNVITQLNSEHLERVKNDHVMNHE